MAYIPDEVRRYLLMSTQASAPDVSVEMEGEPVIRPESQSMMPRRKMTAPEMRIDVKRPNDLQMAYDGTGPKPKLSAREKTIADRAYQEYLSKYGQPPITSIDHAHLAEISDRMNKDWDATGVDPEPLKAPPKPKDPKLARYLEAQSGTYTSPKRAPAKDPRLERYMEPQSGTYVSPDESEALAYADRMIVEGYEKGLAMGEPMKPETVAQHEAAKKRLAQSGGGTVPAVEAGPSTGSKQGVDASTSGNPYAKRLEYGKVPDAPAAVRVNDRALTAPDEKSSIPDNVAKYLMELDAANARNAADRQGGLWARIGGAAAQAFNPLNKGQAMAELNRYEAASDAAREKDQGERFKVFQEGQKELAADEKNNLTRRQMMLNLDKADANLAQAQLTNTQRAQLEQLRGDYAAARDNESRAMAAERLRIFSENMAKTQARAEATAKRMADGATKRAGATEDRETREWKKDIPKHSFSMADNLRDIDRDIEEMGGLDKIKGVGFVKGMYPNAAVGQRAQMLRQKAQAVLNIYSNILFGSALTPGEQANRDKAVAAIQAGKTVGEVSNGLKILKQFVNKGFQQSLAGAPDYVKERIMRDAWDPHGLSLTEEPEPPAPDPAHITQDELDAVRNEYGLDPNHPLALSPDHKWVALDPGEEDEYRAKEGWYVYGD